MGVHLWQDYGWLFQAQLTFLGVLVLLFVSWLFDYPGMSA